MKTNDLLMHYIYVKAVKIDNELINHYNYMQGIEADPSDYLESIILTVRREMFWEIANDIYAILHET